MMLLQAKLLIVQNALTSIDGLEVFHVHAGSEATVPYCVWNEDGEDSSLQSDNHKSEQSISGYVDYFTKTDFDPMVDAIQNALNSVDGLYWTYYSKSYGDPTSDNNNTLHYVWEWRLL